MIDLYSSPAAQQVFQGLIQRGVPAPVAQGFVMNFADESGLRPDINETAPLVPGSRGGFGLAQWTGPRRVALEQYATQSGRPLTDIGTQLDFLVNELQGPEAGAAAQFMGATDPRQAAAGIATHFLRPAPQHLDRRVAEYTGGGVPSFAGTGFNPNAPKPGGGLDDLFLPPAPAMPAARGAGRDDRAEAEKRRRAALFEAVPGLG